MNNKIDLRLFSSGDNVQKTTTSALSSEMKTYYSDYLIDNAEPALVHDQFAQKQSIPKNGGKSVEFRKYNPLPTLTTEMTEGVTPTGQSLKVTTVSDNVKQYGGYVELSDMLLLTAIDNNLLTATKLLGAQAGRTLDSITREVMAGGTNVQYADGSVSSRNELVGGEESGNHYLTVDCIKKAVRFLKRQNAEKIDGSYIAIIHPDCAYDLTSDPAWLDVKTYCDPSDMYEGEIGKIHGVRFIETSEAKVFSAPEFPWGGNKFEICDYQVTQSSGSVTPGCGTGTKYYILGAGMDLSNWEKLKNLPIVIKHTASGRISLNKIVGVNASDGKIYLSSAPPETVVYGDFAWTQGGGYDARDVYATFVFGANAYGTTEIKGGGLEHIVKQLGTGGTADPLNQRATVGWKATKSAVRLMEPFMIRIETTSTYSSQN